MSNAQRFSTLELENKPEINEVQPCHLRIFTVAGFFLDGTLHTNIVLDTDCNFPNLKTVMSSSGSLMLQIFEPSLCLLEINR